MKKRLPINELPENYLRIQLRIAAILAESVNLNTDAQKILETICEFFSWQVGEIWAVDKRKNEVICVSQWLSGSGLEKIKESNYQSTRQVGEGLAGVIWKNKSPYWSMELKTHFNGTEKLIGDLGLNHCFGMPIHLKEDILGVLLFYGKNISQIDEYFLIFFNAISYQIGAFIKRRRIEDELLRLSQHDRLTGLANREILENKINTEIAHALNYNTKAVLLYLDLDDFKKINDSFGHATGDFLLKEVSRRLSSVTRATDILARLGGDEFAVLLVNIKSKQDMMDAAEKIAYAMGQPYFLEGAERIITASIGVSIYPDDCSNAEELINNADKAMYFAKKRGKNQCQILSNNCVVLDHEISKLMDDLPYALERHEFIMYYQPIVAFSTNSIIGHKALLCWRNSSGRLLFPDEFVPALQEKGLLQAIHQWIIEEYCRQASIWEKDNHNAGNIHLPIMQLNDHLIETVSKNVEKAHLKYKNIALELRENMLLETRSNFILINKLKKLGVSIVIENYGVHTSSINLLRNFLVDKLKIDLSFIESLPKDSNSSAIVIATIAMAHALKIKVIADGVVTKEQFNFLKKHGCDEYQGNYFKKPCN
jgi:diguanylate cyclase (GGDEF)-like protein